MEKTILTGLYDGGRSRKKMGGYCPHPSSITTERGYSLLRRESEAGAGLHR